MRSVKAWSAGFALLVLLGASDKAKAQAVAFFPQVSPLNDGVSLNVTPVVSHDRRYVRLSLNPQFQTINGFQTFPVPGAVSGGGRFGGGGGGAGGGIGGGGGGGLGGLGGIGGVGGGAGGGLRSVGVGTLTGMNGPVGGGTMNTPMGFNNYGYDYGYGYSEPMHDDSFNPYYVPRRTKAARPKVAKAKKAVAADPKIIPAKAEARSTIPPRG